MFPKAEGLRDNNGWEVTQSTGGRFPKTERLGESTGGRLPKAERLGESTGWVVTQR